MMARCRLPGPGAARTWSLVLVLLIGLAGCAGDVDRAGGESSEAPRSSGIIPSGAPGIPTATPDIPAAPIIVELTVSDGVVAPGNNEVLVPLGSEVRLLITSDTDEQAHVHGYELTLDLPANQQAELEFTADVPGIFEVELHEGGQLLCALRVA